MYSLWDINKNNLKIDMHKKTVKYAISTDILMCYSNKT